MRKLFAIWAAKLSAIMGRILGKKSSSTPGAVALRICPDLIKELKKCINRDVIVVCGTNGKTTTNNILAAALTKCGHKVICNRLGANMLTGIATAFALECDWMGRLNADYACLEVDEAYTRRVFKQIAPDVVVVTNLFRDQLDRYGDIGDLMEIMREAFEIGNYPTLILNGDDPVSSGFGENYKGEVQYFGIGESVLKSHDNAKEGRLCTKCGTELVYNYYHYSQLGDYSCPNCGKNRPFAQYEAKNVDLSNGLSFDVGDQHIELNYRGFYNIYNILGVFAVMSVLGLSTKDFSSLLDGYKPQIGRMQEVDLGKPFILNLAKNPAGFNQAIQTVIQDKRKKDVIIAVNDMESDGTDVSWLWDVDFELLDDETLNTLSLLGTRRYDLALRFRYSDVKADIISDDMRSILMGRALSDAEVCYVLVNYTMLFSTEKILTELKTEKEKSKNE